jgi:hypothetical protein
VAAAATVAIPLILKKSSKKCEVDIKKKLVDEEGPGAGVVGEARWMYSEAFKKWWSGAWRECSCSAGCKADEEERGKRVVECPGKLEGGQERTRSRIG